MSMREREKAKLRKQAQKEALPRAILRRFRMSPYKVRLVVDLVRGKPVEEALVILGMVEKKASKPLLKLLRSAMANAEEKGYEDIESMLVKRAYVNRGPTMKRWMSRSMGRANQLLKRTSDITIELGKA
jgi:large subunit ribosomal protein L22